MFCRTEGDRVECGEGLVAGAAIGCSFEGDMQHSGLSCTFGRDAIVAGCASGGADIGMIEDCHPGDKGRVALSAVGRGRDMRRWHKDQSATEYRPGAVMAGEAGFRDERMFGRTESDGVEGREGLVASRAIIRSWKMGDGGIVLALGGHAVVAGHARGRADILMIEDCDPGGEGRVALGAIGSRGNMRRWLLYQGTLQNRYGTIVAIEASCRDQSMFRSTEGDGVEGDVVFMAGTAIG